MRIVALLLALLATGCVVVPHGRIAASEVRGVILKDGRPVVGAKVIRTVVIGHSGETRKQEATTDERGAFVWGRITDLGMVQSIATWVYSHEYSLEQSGSRVILWRGGKVGIADLAERYSLQEGEISGNRLFHVHDGWLGFTIDLGLVTDK